MRTILPLLLATPLLTAAALPAGSAGSAPRDTKPRVLVLTDISSLTAGVREPDDGQSLIRFLLYSCHWDVEGLVASSNMGHGQVVRPELIRQAVEAYGKVLPNLRRHHPGYPSAAALMNVVKAGQPVADRGVPVERSVGEGKDTEASEWIIRQVDRRDDRPLWVLIWGGSADLAQALWKVRQTRTPAEAERWISRVRVHSIGDQDSTGPWIREQFPTLFTVLRGRAIRGMYRGGDRSLVSPEWVEEHARNGHGPLGALYPNYNGGDIFPGPVRGIKEGDTPSFLSLIPNGLGDPAHPEWGGWGGRLRVEGERENLLSDAIDPHPDNEKDHDPRMSGVYRWREAYQADFQARLDWCVRPYAEANHPPKVEVAGALRRTVRPGQSVTLDAGRSTDPDRDRLTYRWLLHEAGSYAGPVEISDASSARARLTVPADAAGRTLHVVVAVRDDGTPALTHYRRVVLDCRP
ncbi:MAG: nucleoside hydrolase-like domain-containing protein [Armatimonadota bacterium]